MSRNYLWERIEVYISDELSQGGRVRATAADLARETGISEATLSKWKKTPTLPEPALLAQLSNATKIPYTQLLAAALKGKTYLPEEASVMFSALVGAEQVGKNLTWNVLRSTKGRRVS